MKPIVNFYDEKSNKANTCGASLNIPKGVTGAVAKDLWIEAMCTIDAPDGSTLFSYPCTASTSFAQKVDFYMHDPDHVYEKFDGEQSRYQDIYKAAGFSKSTWGRIQSGALADLERGNVFAFAIALRLNEEQLVDLLQSAGFCLNCDLDLDRAMLYFIHKGTYHRIQDVMAVLGEICDVENGLDCFFFRPRTKPCKKKKDEE